MCWEPITLIIYLAHWSSLYLVGGLVAKSCPILETPWTVTLQTAPPLEFSRQEYWNGLPFPSSKDLPDPGINQNLLHCWRILSCWATRAARLYIMALLFCAQRLGRIRPFETPWTVAPRLLRPWDSPGKSTGVGCHALLQGNLPDPGLLHSQVNSLPSEPPRKPNCSLELLREW